MSGVLDVAVPNDVTAAFAAGTRDGAAQRTTSAPTSGTAPVPAPARGGPASAGVRRHHSVRSLSRASAPAGATRSGRSADWIRAYLRALVIGDLLAAAAAATVAFFVRLPGFRAPMLYNETYNNHYLLVSLLLPVLWVGAMAVGDCYDPRILSVGPEEYQRAGRGFLGVLAIVGFGSYAVGLHLARGYVVLALPLALLLSMLVRRVLRKRLHRARGQGRACASVVAVGDTDSVIDLAQRVHAEVHVGMRVVGACVPQAELSDADARRRLREADITPLGDLDSIVVAVSRVHADTVAVTSTHEIGPRRLRELSWELETTDADLVVAPGLIEVAGPRLHIRPVTGLPLLHVEKPEFAGGRRVLKGLVDRTAALAGMVLLSPVLFGLWLAVRLSSSGPAFFRQTRVGKDGQEFRIWKFRSMHVDAEARLAALAARNENSDGLLFKMRHDPRVTRVGRAMRRYSLDELPQLINVVNGTMSLVGPRPPLPSEVAQYGRDVRRRLLVRPGLTGLWQVSGRSDLSWEESVRLDLRYVENWSLGQDALILWKTASAVLRGAGAY